MTNKERSVEEIVEEFKKEFVRDNGELVEPSFKDSGDASPAIFWLTQTLQAERQKREEMVGKFEQFIDDIPEAYGWGKEDEEADRGYQICSKSVKAEGVRLLQALTQPNNPK